VLDGENSLHGVNTRMEIPDDIETVKQIIPKIKKYEDELNLAEAFVKRTEIPDDVESVKLLISEIQQEIQKDEALGTSASMDRININNEMVSIYPPQMFVII